MIFIWQNKPTPSDVHIFLETCETSWIWPLLKNNFFCSFCCSHYAPLGYKKMETDRVCFACFEKLKTSEKILLFPFNYFDNRHGIFRFVILSTLGYENQTDVLKLFKSSSKCRGSSERSNKKQESQGSIGENHKTNIYCNDKTTGGTFPTVGDSEDLNAGGVQKNLLASLRKNEQFRASQERERNVDWLLEVPMHDNSLIIIGKKIFIQISEVSQPRNVWVSHFKVYFHLSMVERLTSHQSPITVDGQW